MRKKAEYIRVRSILGNEVFRNKNSGIEYLVRWSKRGNPRLVKLK